MLVSQLNRSRRIGIEIEMAVPLIGGGEGQDLRTKMADIFTANGLRSIARSYSHAPVPSGYDVVVESDSSIRGETQYQGIEWVQVECKTKPLDGTDEFNRVVSKLCDLCRYLGARQNTSTAVHLHIEFKEAVEEPATIRSFFNLVHRFEPVVFGLVAPSRRTSQYCKPLPNKAKLLHPCSKVQDFQRALLSAGLERYWGVNLTHLFSFSPRVEFRHHHGTLDFEKIRHWRNLCLRLIDHSIQRNCKAATSQLPNDNASLMRMLVTLGMKSNTRVFRVVDPELRATGRYLARRWHTLNPTPPPVPQQGPETPPSLEVPF